jgi:signal transduction histidine kinase
MNLRAAKTLWERHPAEAIEQLDAAIDLIGQSQHELNVLIHTLRPVQLEDEGLIGAILETASPLFSQIVAALPRRPLQRGAIQFWSEIQNETVI